MIQIGIAHTPFKEKFSIPRQSSLVEIEGVIELFPPYNRPEALEGLEKFSHIWILFEFHFAEFDESRPKLMVRPPRLGGNKKIGVFATRSPYRPNRIGMSAVRLDKIEDGKIYIRSHDILDKSPILDIKPYLQHVDNHYSVDGWTHELPEKYLSVVILDAVKAKLLERHPASVLDRIEEILKQDPRPAYHDDQKQYGSMLYDFDLKWHVTEEILTVFELDWLN